TENMVISRLTRALDNAVDDAAAQGGNLIVGPPAAVQHLRQAREAARREFASFQPENREVAHFLDAVRRPGVSGQDVAQALIGTAEVGSKSSTSQILHHVSRLYPITNTSGEAMAARQAVRDGLVYHAVYSGDAAPAAMQPGHVATRIDRALNGRGREIMESVLTAGEIEQLRGYSGLLRTMQ